MGIVLIGILIAVAGGLFYLVPTPAAQATTQTEDAQGVNTQTTTASVSVPPQVSLATLIVGVVVLLLGLVLPAPSPVQVVQERPGHEPEGRAEYSRQEVHRSDVDGSRRTVVKERRETHDRHHH